MIDENTPRKSGSINHLRLTVTDIPRSEVFYGRFAEFMGYKLVERTETRLSWAMPASHGNLQFLILSVAENAQPHDRYAAGFHHCAWNAETREQVDQFHNLLVENGVEILDPPADYGYEPGYYAVFFADPDGLKLELAYVPQCGSETYWHLFEARGVNPLDDIQYQSGSNATG
ncbi:VOC family protein [Yoonia sp. 2307UL14-13]|uniref:VOC family protein n=1 Tax=Yoonia sp. 2307UL14-13 TaxID=3126506 RepID=UPI0030B6F881